MKELIFATNNQHKVEEIMQVMAAGYNIITLKQAGINIDIPEPYDTLAENAIIKAKTIHSLTCKNCFSEDTGLEVDALNGAPGVKTARYAAPGENFVDNNDKLLTRLKGVQQRKAAFRTVVCLIIDNEQYLFEGQCHGSIATDRHGTGGFGYDPVFIPEGYNETFAQLPAYVKNQVSHRAKAINKLMAFLSTYGNFKAN